MTIQKLFFALCLMTFSFFGCQEDVKQTNDNIDKTADVAKNFIDLISNGAKDVVSDKDLQAKLKNAIVDLKDQGVELQKLLEEKSPGWKNKIEAMANDPKLKEQLKKLEKEGGDITLKLEEILNDKDLQAQLTGIFSKFEEEGKVLQQYFEEKGPIWKEKLEDITNDPKFKDRLKTFGNNAEQILKELEDVAKNTK